MASYSGEAGARPAMTKTPARQRAAEWTPVDVVRLRAKAAGAAKATAVRVARAQARAAELRPVIEEIRASGITSLHGIAQALTERGIPTAWGKGPWQAKQVQRVLARL